MQKKVTCKQRKLKETEWVDDECENRTCKFTFLIEDYPTKPELSSKPQELELLETLDGRLVVNWKLGNINSEDLIKHIYYYAKKDIQKILEDSRNGVLSNSYNKFISMDDHLEHHCPVDISKIPNVDGDVFYVNLG
jgi:hypothetical protein